MLLSYQTMIHTFNYKRKPKTIITDSDFWHYIHAKTRHRYYKAFNAKMDAFSQRHFQKWR